jgi:hypothetical protein
VPDKEWEIVPPLAQRWHRNRKNVQTIVQIFSEFAFIYHPSQIVVCCRDQPHVGPDRMRTSQAFELMFLQDPKKLGLQLGWDIADLIEKEGASVGQFESARPLGDCAREGATLVAEQLAFEQTKRNSGAIHLDEGVMTAVTHVVNRLCYAAFAGSGFTQDQHSRVGPRNNFGLTQDSPELFALAD